MLEKKLTVSMISITCGYDPQRIICISSRNKLRRLDAVSWLALDVEVGYWNGLYTQLQVEIAIYFNNEFYNLGNLLYHRENDCV
jgi:hypothetical protein